MRFIGIVGNPRAGKSTIIGNICGLPLRNARDLQRVEHVPSRAALYAISSSPQETGETIKKLASAFKKVAADKNAIGFVIALQPNRPNRRASMENIFDMALSYGFDVAAFVIDRPYRTVPYARWSDPQFAIDRLKAIGIAARRLNARQVSPHRNAKTVLRALLRP